MPNCITDRCFNEAAPNRKICYGCKSRKWVAKNRIAKCWHNIKRSAKKRDIPFLITLAEFKKLIKGTGYVENAGRLSNDLTIDRIIPTLGYTYDNLQVIKKGDNVRKYHEDEKDYPF